VAVEAFALISGRMTAVAPSWEGIRAAGCSTLGESCRRAFREVFMSTRPPVITDAAPSLDEEQGHRRRTYVILMVVHLVGFAASYPLYLWTPVAGVVAVVLTGMLPWIAVLLANAATRPRH
jgi:hypothetical protein